MLVHVQCLSCFVHVVTLLESEEEEVVCSALTVENGSVTPTGEVAAGTTVTVSCNFESNSNVELVCSEEGSFGGDVPVCAAEQGTSCCFYYIPFSAACLHLLVVGYVILFYCFKVADSRLFL